MSVADPLATPDRFAVVGDMHGHGGFAARAMEYARERHAKVVIQAGDFGFRSVYDRFLTGLSAVALDLDLPILFADGNHEHHENLLALPVDPHTGLRRVAPGIWHLPRGFRWTWDDVEFLALGGAHSVDRVARTPGVDWFEQEHLNYADCLRAVDGGPADVMITHDAPAGVDLTAALRPGYPPRDVELAEQHRLTLRHVVDEVRPRWLFHGHYHHAHVTQLAGEGYRTVVRGLADHRADTLSRSVFVQPLRTLAAYTPPTELAVTGRGTRTARSR